MFAESIVQDDDEASRCGCGERMERYRSYRGARLGYLSV
jgi:hypothetical protein